MNRITHLLATGVAITALSAVPVLAQSQSQTTGQAQQPQTNMSVTTESAVGPLLTAQAPDQLVGDDIVGMTVINLGGEEIGEIDDIVVNSDGTVAGAVLSVGGFLGMGSKPVAVEWSQITFDKRDTQHVALVDLSKERLESAPEFRFRPKVTPPAANMPTTIRTPPPLSKPSGTAD
ncbi:MAG: PRC-barrel domain-containing protein [Alphaproteobacteria bacterium]